MISISLEDIRKFWKKNQNFQGAQSDILMTEKSSKSLHLKSWKQQMCDILTNNWSIIRTAGNSITFFGVCLSFLFCSPASCLHTNTQLHTNILNASLCIIKAHTSPYLHTHGAMCWPVSHCCQHWFPFPGVTPVTTAIEWPIFHQYCRFSLSREPPRLSPSLCKSDSLSLSVLAFPSFSLNSLFPPRFLRAHVLILSF